MENFRREGKASSKCGLIPGLEKCGLIPGLEKCRPGIRPAASVDLGSGLEKCGLIPGLEKCRPGISQKCISKWGWGEEECKCGKLIHHQPEEKMMGKTLRQEVEESIRQQCELRKKAAEVWNTAVFQSCDRHILEMMEFLKSPMIDTWGKS